MGQANPITLPDGTQIPDYGLSLARWLIITAACLIVVIAVGPERRDAVLFRDLPREGETYHVMVHEMSPPVIEMNNHDKESTLTVEDKLAADADTKTPQAGSESSANGHQLNGGDDQAVAVYSMQ